MTRSAPSATDIASPSSNSACGEIAGGVPGPAADRETAGPRRRIRRRERPVRGELRGLSETAAEVGGPRADLERGWPGRGGALDVAQRGLVAAAAGTDPGAGEPALRISMQAQRVVEQRLGRGVVEALGGLRSCVAERRGGQLQVTAQPGVLGDDHRVGRGPRGQHPADLAVEQGGAPGGGAGRESLADQLVPEP